MTVIKIVFYFLGLFLLAQFFLISCARMTSGLSEQAEFVDRTDLLECDEKKTDEIELCEGE
jgi:hypothetical protein